MPATLFIVSSDPSSVRLAREKVANLAHRWCTRMSEEDSTALSLITSELVTNAIVHSGSPTIAVRFTGRRNRLTVEVIDGSVCHPKHRRACEDEENGRGLLLVAAYATRHGTEIRPDGKRCWAEIDLKSANAGRRRAAVIARRLRALRGRSPRHAAVRIAA